MKTLNRNFLKFLTKEIKKNEVYISRKREIGDIKFVEITHIQTKSVYPVYNEYCQYSDFLCNVSGEKQNLSLIFRIFSNGIFEWVA